MAYRTQEFAPKQTWLPLETRKANGDYVIPRGAKIGTEIELHPTSGIYGILRNDITPMFCQEKDCAVLDLYVRCGDCPARPLTSALKKCVSGVKEFGSIVNVYNDGIDETMNSYNVGGQGDPTYYVLEWGVENSNQTIWVGY